MITLFLSPIGPSFVLWGGALLLLLVGRSTRRLSPLVWMVVMTLAVAGLLWFQLRLQPVVPNYSRPWRPIGQPGANLVWSGEGWNWYISGLLLLLSTLGILLDWDESPATQSINGEPRAARYRNRATTWAVHLAVLGASLLFVSSSNLLTTILTWVFLDLLLLVRAHPTTRSLPQQANPSADPSATPPTDPTQPTRFLQDDSAKGFSLVGALLLMVGLLPAGIGGPGQSFQQGVLAQETALLLLLASLIRAGIYPFHLWLLSNQNEQVNLSERLLEQLSPVLCGLWLLGWTLRLGGGALLLRSEIISLLVVSLLCSALAAYGARTQARHNTFVLITAAGGAVLCGALAQFRDPSALIWPVTAFALGGGLWLIGERVYRLWGWQLPVSLGAAALAGIPFTPGFLAQPSLARMLLFGGPFAILFLFYLLGQTIHIVSMLRSWGVPQAAQATLTKPSVLWRLLFACVAVTLPLSVAGILPNTVTLLASMPDSIPSVLGNPPSVVANAPVWITLGVPVIFGLLCLFIQSSLPATLTGWLALLSDGLSLEWFFRSAWWLVNGFSMIWGNGLRVVEGAGALGWLLVFLLIGYLLGQ